MRFKVDLYVYELKLLITSNRFQPSNLFFQPKFMDQISHRQPQTPLNQSKTNGNHLAKNSQPHRLSGIIVMYAVDNKKKEVIDIQDSSEVQPEKPIIVKPKETKPPLDTRKSKKVVFRCMLCKEPGKKASMRSCLDCKANFHTACLEQEGELSPRYRCRKCRHKRDQNDAMVKKAEKGEKANQQRMQNRKIEKEKKKTEILKKMNDFQERYPYYFQDSRIKFPIEDKLLFIYKELFEVTEVFKLKPVSHPLIPSYLLGEMLQIENFFSTFKEELVAYGSIPSQIKKKYFFLSFESQGYDVVFTVMIECILKIYLSDIFDKNKTDNVKILHEHPFFALLIHLNDNVELDQEFLVRSAEEILRYLATIPSMKRSFEDFAFPEDLNKESKISLIVQLINGLSEVDEFHELVSIKSQKMQILTKEKTELVALLKVDEAQNLSNNEKLKDMSIAERQMEISQEGVTRYLTKELDRHKKKMQKIASLRSKSQENIKEIRNKIAQIARTMPFLTSQIEFLGFDRNNSEYFFYIRQPNKVYVKFRSYLLDQSQEFYFYQGKETIIELVKNLNTKGLREKHLSENINSYIKDEIIHNNISEEICPDNFLMGENKYQGITLDNILRLIKDVEETFTAYLSLKNYQWSSPNVRQMFMAQLMLIEDVHILKEQLKSLQENFLFAQYANNEHKDYSEDEQNKFQIRQGRKKIPIRIWGINSEKTKKYWIQYLEDAIDITGVWICAYIFKNNVEKYVKKKMEAYYEQELKERKYKKPAKEKVKQVLVKDSQKFIQREKRLEILSSQYMDEQVQESIRPNLRKRKTKKMNIVHIQPTQDSDMQEEEMQEEQVEEEQSSNEDHCEICQQYGDMICCDTCPKVYHQECLKIKDIPEGEWSCFKCLQKLSNERQTRSRVKKVGKYI